MTTSSVVALAIPECTGVKAPMNRFEFILRQVSGGKLPSFSGSAWRGALGRALRKQSCRHAVVRCACPSNRCLCVYRRWFEPAKVQGDLPLGHAQPRPYVVQPDEVFVVYGNDAPSREPNRDYRLALLVAGSAIGDLPVVIEALREAAAAGIGRNASRFALLEVHQHLNVNDHSTSTLWRRGKWCNTPTPIAPTMANNDAPHEAWIEWLTPLRLRERNCYVFDPRALTFPVVARALLRRAAALDQWYGSRAAPSDFRERIATAHKVRMDNHEVRLARFSRFSSTQNRKVAMDGLIGRSRVSGHALAAFWPQLIAGQWSHLGKGCTIGLGRYRIYSNNNAAQVN